MALHMGLVRSFPRPAGPGRSRYAAVAGGVSGRVGKRHAEGLPLLADLLVVAPVAGLALADRAKNEKAKARRGVRRRGREGYERGATTTPLGYLGEAGA